MMMFGWLFFLVLIGLPILVIVYLLGRNNNFRQNQPTGSNWPQNPPATTTPVVNDNPSTPAPSRYCSHCGAGLQPDWTHCPQCGAPVG